MRTYKKLQISLRFFWTISEYNVITYSESEVVMGYEKLTEKHPVQFGPILWELLQIAAVKESQKQRKIVTAAEYVRQVLARNLRRKGIREC